MSAGKSIDPIDTPVFIYENTLLKSNDPDLLNCKENAIKVNKYHNNCNSLKDVIDIIKLKIKLYTGSWL